MQQKLQVSGWKKLLDFFPELESLGASVAQSSKQAPFTSEFVGSILATESCEKSPSILCRKSWVFSWCSGFLPQRKWVRIK